MIEKSHNAALFILSCMIIYKK